MAENGVQEMDLTRERGREGRDEKGDRGKDEREK